MSVEPGQKLGPYEVLSPLGRGGQGEVYKARDTRLDREVAIKVLPAGLSQEASWKARFEREAKAISQINHPHICTLHDVGAHDGMDYLVMECLEGETLVDRLKRGVLPRDEALELARQIASALGAAHDRGIIHRDLKPGNIMLTKSGVKLLDFGIAKWEAATDSEAPTAMAPLTQEGALVGTIAYMAPEQLERRDADARSDIYALGAVVYEMLTGRRAYDEEERRKIEPAFVDDVVSKALAKAPEDRWQSARDVEMLLALPIASASVAPPTRGSAHLGWASLVVVGLAGLATWFLSSTPPREVTRLSVTLPEGQRLYEDQSRSFDVSHDGRRLVYSSRDSSQSRSDLYVRELDSFEARLVPGTDNARQPAFSPDGDWIAYVDGNRSRIRRVSRVDGAILDVCTSESIPSGLTWSQEGLIHFGTDRGGIWRVSENGGTPEPVTALAPGESNHIDPNLLPDGRGLLFTVNTGNGYFQVALLPEDDTEHRVLFDGSGASYVSTGHIVFGRFGIGLFAVAFDLDSLEIQGQPVPLPDVPTESASWKPQFRAVPGGTLVYAPSSTPGSEVVWVDRNGGASEVVFRSNRRYHTVHLSADGQRFAADEAGGGSNHIWVHDLARGTRTLAVSGTNNQVPRFDPSGARIAYEGGQNGILLKSADGMGESVQLASPEYDPSEPAWSPDGTFLVFSNGDLWVLPIGAEPRSLLSTKADERAPAVSPDGRWIAYQSDASGRPEIYVQPFPDPGARHLISPSGGKEPVWSRDGRELFYRENLAVMAVAIESDPSFRAGVPQRLFEGPYLHDNAGHASYDVSPDGQRFLMIRNPEAGTPELRVVLNFAKELQERVPMN